MLAADPPMFSSSIPIVHTTETLQTREAPDGTTRVAPSYPGLKPMFFGKLVSITCNMLSIWLPEHSSPRVWHGK